MDEQYISLYRKVKKYFADVVCEERFILGIDVTGIYVFGISISEKEFYDISVQLGIGREQVVWCSPTLGDEALAAWVRGMAARRRKVFRPKEIKEIMACYYPPSPPASPLPWPPGMEFELPEEPDPKKQQMRILVLSSALAAAVLVMLYYDRTGCSSLLFSIGAVTQALHAHEIRHVWYSWAAIGILLILLFAVVILIGLKLSEWLFY